MSATKLTKLEVQAFNEGIVDPALINGMIERCSKFGFCHDITIGQAECFETQVKAYIGQGRTEATNRTIPMQPYTRAQIQAHQAYREAVCEDSTHG